MKYSLRSLMIAVLALPPLLAFAAPKAAKLVEWIASEPVRQPDFRGLGPFEGDRDPRYYPDPSTSKAP